jgi:NAD kinase
MGLLANPGITVITRPTRLEGLKKRWGTAGQAKFVMRAMRAHAALAEPEASSRTMTQGKRKIVPQQTVKAALPDAEFEFYQREEDAYEGAIQRLERDLDFGLPIKFLDRSFVPNFDFSRTAVVVVVGQDGLVANAAKYVGNLPIIAVNPDPQRIDGILLPFGVADARRAVGKVLESRYSSRMVTLAEVRLNDGQRLLAFNDFFAGAASHVSARYTIQVDRDVEPQSSSGVLVSTGAGSTGWMSSVFNMTAGVTRMLGGHVENSVKLPWEDRRLIWAVREPFASKTSKARLVAGLLDEGKELVLESLMPSEGVIFSDGVESDFLAFNTGTIAEFRASDQRARLVIQ